ncbi:MAG TPA: polysaccharide biosynthesis tyrosine autokinase [Terriglobales bacterium]|nr:polysaccharide biosynthesis tyrosine autokinase [Terriglobales bacterium]
MSKFYEAMQKIAGADDRNGTRSLGTGETLVPFRRESSPAAVLIRPPRPVEAAGKQGTEWLRAIQIVRKHWRISALFAAVLMLTVIIIVFTMKPVYEPVARVEVDPPGEQFSLEGPALGSDAEYLETQAQNLKSDRLAIDVIHRLHLDQDPEMLGSSGKSSSADLGKYQLTNGEYSALHSVRANLNVKRDTASRLISVSFASHDPRMAALVTNTIVSAFIDDTYRDQHDAIRASSEWLARQLDDIRARMEESNRALVEFQKSIGVADVDANKSTFGEQMDELNRQLTQAQADRIQLEALLKSVRAGSPDVLPEIRNNPVIQQLSTKLAEQRAELSQARVIYGPNHPNAKKLQSQVDDLQSELQAQKTAVLSSIRTSYAAAQARENLMDSEIKGASSRLSQMGRYNDLKKEAQTNSELYNTLYAKVKEAGIAAASKSSNLRVVDEAHVLDAPTRPNRELALFVGLCAALFGGVVVAFLREHFDTRIFTPEDVRDSIGGSNIAVLPLFFANQGNQLPGVQANGQKSISAGNGSGAWKLPPGVAFLLDRPHSPEAEALRSLYTSVMLSRPDNPPQVVLVASSLPGEGKTTVAVNFATALAQHGNTCLVDADLRRGSLASALGVPTHVGLTDVLIEVSTLEHVLIQVPSMPNLTLVPAHAGSAKAGQLMCSDRMAEVIATLRKKFQFVVIDSAPILPFADGRAISNLVDGIIFVGRSGITTRDLVHRSLELLNQVRSAPVLEFVLNAADLNSPQYRYHHYGYEYYDRASQENPS